MVYQNGREELRGAERETLDLLAQILTPKQWAELLRAPLEVAAGNGNRGLARKLVGAGAEIGDALHEAVICGHEGIVSDLLENGASLAARNTDGNTPLHYAVLDEEPEMMKLLLLNGADKDAWDVLDSFERTPLVLAADCGRTSAALALMAAGADASLWSGRFKRSVLHRASFSGHQDFLRAMIEHGADVNAGDENGKTPLHFAALRNKIKAIDALVEAGAHIEARDNVGLTPLHGAAEELNLDALLALLRYGADVNPQDNHRRTPLDFAVCNAGATQGAADVVESLLRSGADETILNNKGEAAADVVGISVRKEGSLVEDAERVHELLANAPADRAWRRRGFLILCRAHPDRVQLVLQESSSAPAGATQSIASGAALERSGASGGTGASRGSTVFERTSSDWADVVARVLGLQEEGIFRTTMEYL